MTQEVDETMGLADKFHLVKQVAQTVQVLCVSLLHTYIVHIVLHAVTCYFLLRICLDTYPTF